MRVFPRNHRLSTKLLRLAATLVLVPSIVMGTFPLTSPVASAQEPPQESDVQGTSESNRKPGTPTLTRKSSLASSPAPP